MTMEEIESGRDPMEIDGFGPGGEENRRENAVPDEFNANYLKVYYGMRLYDFDFLWVHVGLLSKFKYRTILLDILVITW